MRSESRLGNLDDNDEDRSFSRTSSRRAADTTDTSGTEGSGPVIGNRRRKKSTTSSSSRKAAAAARAGNHRELNSSPPKRLSPRKERGDSHQMQQQRKNSYVRSPFGAQTSPLRTESALEYSSPVSQRAPLPSEFRYSRYRSDALPNADYLEREKRRNSIGNPDRAEMWPRGEELPAPRSDERRRRDVSEAHSPGGTGPTSEASSRHSRVSVDASGVSKHLSRSTNTRYGTLNDGRGLPSDWSDRGSNRSTSELLRQRKVSTSSSLSQRSSGGASELHRSASRASMRRSHGKDVFDDGGAPPLPYNSSHPLSPRFLTTDMQQDQAQAMAQALAQKQDHLRDPRAGDGWRREVEDLQARIDQLTAAASGPSSQRDSYSRSSSRASVSAPRSHVSSTPSTQVSRQASRPATEPRHTRNGHDRAASELMPAYKHYDSSSRLAVRDGGERVLPVTPNMAGNSQRTSGAQTGLSTRSGRFSSASQSSKKSATPAGSGPLHERNLLNSVEVFERHFLEPSRPNLDTPVRTTPEAVELVNKFKETSEAAIGVNAGLRALLQSVLERQIDAEVGDDSMDSGRLLSAIDRSLSLILRDSDEQIRSLTDGIITFTRAERERDRLRRLASDQGSSGSATLPRSASRHSSLGLSQMSPEKERAASRIGDGDHEASRSSLDLRRRLSARDRDVRITASYSNPSMQALESHSQASDMSSRSGGNGGMSRKSSDSGQHKSSRRFSLLHDSSSKMPTSPYSPSPNPAGGSSSRIRASITSPVLELHDQRGGKLGHSISHARSASELSPKLRAGEGELTGVFQRSPLSRREKSSTNSTQTVRAPPSLSPRRPRLSFPSVSATTVGATTASITGAPVDGPEPFFSHGVGVGSTNGSMSPIDIAATGAEDHAMLTSENLRQKNNTESVKHNHNTTSSLDAAARMFKSLGRSAGKRESREMGKEAHT